MENVVNLWQGRRVFLTGHTGFKGGWLALWLAKLGARVRGYALDPSTEPNIFHVAEVGKSIEDVRGDILDRTKLEASLLDFAPDIVFHLAAQPLVRRSYADPLETYATNVMGTAHVLEAVRKSSSVRGVVSVTTDKCYENKEWIWPYRENDPLGGYDPYSSSKACAELVCASYRSAFFPVDRLDRHRVALATARAGNVIGGGDWSSDRLVPDLIRGFVTRQPVSIRRPNAIRPWQHVLEPLQGYIRLAEKLFDQQGQFASAFNFGPSDDGWPVWRIANRMADSWGKDATWTLDAEPGVHEAGSLRLDSSKARADLNWETPLGIEAAVQWTVDWYRAWHEGQDMHLITTAQIDSYERLIVPPAANLTVRR